MMYVSAPDNAASFTLFLYQSSSNVAYRPPNSLKAISPGFTKLGVVRQALLKR